jgi:23S rRNA (cytidine1920-2'-O)/16S rRNA (cytidine1409-2'-O)-methyltransferase
MSALIGRCRTDWPTLARDLVARIDAELVRRGLARSRAHAGDLIRSGRVLVDGGPAAKPAQPVAAQAVIDVAGEPEDLDVGRGASKLRGALTDLANDLANGPANGPAVAGRRCVDIGASTGGFTQVLLAAGAESVVAVDVGHGQLAAAIADDPRVIERSGTNVRDVGPDDLGGPFDLLVADLSFISLTLVMPGLAGLVRPGGDLVLLVKPQFEVGRERLGKTGVVRSQDQRLEAVASVEDAALEAGLTVRGVVPSRTVGGTGNIEFFVWAQR